MAAAGVGQQHGGVDDAGDREAELRFGVVDRMAAHHCRACSPADVEPAAQDRAEDIGPQPFQREGDEVERRDRPPPIAYTSESALAAAMRPKS